MQFKMFADHWSQVWGWKMSLLALIGVKDSITHHLQVLHTRLGEGSDENKVLCDSKDHTLIL